MSQENVEGVKAGFAAHNCGDVDARVEPYDPEAVLETLLLGPTMPLSSPYTIRYNVREFLNAYPTSNALTLRLKDQVLAIPASTAAPIANPAVLDDLPTRPRRRRW